MTDSPTNPPEPAPPAPKDNVGDDGGAETIWGMVGFSIVIASLLVGFVMMVVAAVWAYRTWLR